MVTKALFLIIGISCATLFQNSFAQWTSPTGPYTYTTDQVGIGTTTPGQQLELYHQNIPPTLRLYYSEEYTNIWDISNNFNLELKFGNSPSSLNTKFIFTETGKLGIGTTSPSYLLQANGDIYANGGWLRVAGTSGLYFQTYGGGFNMTDNTWIRTYGSKSFLHSSGIMRTDGTFQVGPDGNRFVVNSSGNVGIGTTSSPNSRLQIVGTSNTKALDILGYAKINSDRGLQFFRSSWGTYAAQINISSYTGPRGLRFVWSENGSFSDSQDLLFLSQTGNVGIGSCSPSAKLTVKGDILCSKITVVEVNNIPDYVFAKDYNLMKLDEIEEYIKEHSHLPGIPSASEIEKKGLDLVQMNIDLLKKIEELTLLMIEQNKAIQALQSQMNLQVR